MIENAAMHALELRENVAQVPLEGLALQLVAKRLAVIDLSNGAKET